VIHRNFTKVIPF